MDWKSSYISYGAALGISITLCSVLVNEVLWFLKSFLSVNAFIMTISVIISWITLDNIVLCSDIKQLTNENNDDNPTDCEVILLKKLNYTNRRLEETSELLAREKTSHNTTKSQMQSIQKKKITPLLHERLV